MSGLVLDHVSKMFSHTEGDGTTHALDDINLHVNEGEFISIVGTSGCGKSTILRIVAGLTPPTQGEISFQDKPIRGTNPNRGIVFQKPTLFPWMTVEKNVSFSLRMQHTYKENKEKVKEMLDMVGLYEFRNDYPHQLSGGMAQRVALVRTLINEPQIMLLDEPLGALDAFTRMTVQDEILSIWQKRKNTVLMVTHDVDEAIYMGTSVLVMEPRPGRVQKQIPIALDYPRNRSSKEFVAYRNEILDMLHFGHKNI